MWRTIITLKITKDSTGEVFVMLMGNYWEMPGVGNGDPNGI